MIGVTGSTGFIGAHLMQQLGESVVPVDMHDIVDSSELERVLRTHGCSSLVHLASPLPKQGSGNQGGLEQEIVGLTELCVEAVARLEHCHLVLLSSVRVHPNGCTVFTSDAPVQPIDGYGKGKARAELVCASAADDMHPVTVLRPASVQGVSLDGDVRGLIGVFAEQAVLDGEVRVMGDGSSTKDMLHVSDVVAVIVAALDAPPTQVGAVRVLPIGSGDGISVLELGQGVAARIGAVIRHIDADPDDLSGVVDVGPALTQIGWSAQTNIEDIIEEIVVAVGSGG